MNNADAALIVESLVHHDIAEIAGQLRHVAREEGKPLPLRESFQRAADRYRAERRLVREFARDLLPENR